MLTLHYMGSREFPFFQNDQFNFFLWWLYFLLYFLLGVGSSFFFLFDGSLENEFYQFDGSWGNIYYFFMGGW